MRDVETEPNSEPQALRGRCLCGAVQIAVRPPTRFHSHCHCQSCRLSHGAPYVTWTSVPLERFAVLAGAVELRWYRSSPCIEWGFCSTCGSSMLYRAVADGHRESPGTDRMYIAVGSLIDPMDRPVDAHVSYEERLPSTAPGDAVPCFRGKTSERMAVDAW